MGRAAREGTGGARRGIALVALIVTAACSPGAPKVQTVVGPGAGEPSEQVYRHACAPCHGTDGTGHGPQAARLRVPPADLTHLTTRAGGTFPRELVIDTITGAREIPDHGTREMPVWEEHFGPTGQGAAGVASLYARRRTEGLADYVATLQRP